MQGDGSAATAMLGLPGFVLLAVSEVDGELEQAIETTAVVEFCRGCGVQAVPHGRRPVRVRDLPAAGRPVTLIWVKRVWRCAESRCPARTWSEISGHIRARASLTERARAEACRRVGQDGHDVAAVAVEYGVGWHTIMRAVDDHGRPLIDDPVRLDGVAAVGVDETAFLAATATHATEFVTGIVDLTGHPRRAARLLDVVEGRSGTALSDWVSGRDRSWRDAITVAALDPFRGYATALRTQLPNAVRVLDAFHVTRLGLAAVDEVRRRVQQGTLHRRGHKHDPLYRIRRLLRRAPETLSERAWARLETGLLLGDPHGEVTQAWMAAHELRYLYRRGHDLLDARRRLHDVLARCVFSDIPELLRLARTLNAWSEELLAYFTTGGVSNGPTEAINLLIKRIKRVGWWSQPAVATPVLVIDWKGVCVPGPRLTSQERTRIEAMWISGLTFPEIAAALGRDRSTVWREVRRNHSHTHGFKHAGRVKGEALRSMVVRGSGLYRWGYDAAAAQQRASSRACRPRQVKLGYRPSPRTTVRQYRPRGTGSSGWGSGFARGLPTDLRVIVLGKLRRRWSPQQISSWLAHHFAGYPELQVSHETIYQALYVQSRGNLRRELSNQVALRQGRRTRRPRAAVAGAVRSRRPWAEGFNISSRPAEITDRAVPGHWEGDLLLGAGGSSAIVTLVERTSRYVLLGHLPDTRDSGSVISTLSTLAQRLPGQLFRTLTWDCGTEMAQHRSFTVASDCQVFFADPHSPWQRGSNENTNGLLRQYFPKSRTDFKAVSQAQLDDVATELNQRPRQTLSWQTPHDALSALVATAD